MSNKKPELLAPAGNLDILKIAFLYGADAVYCGTPDFAMRARVGFDMESLEEGIKYTHSLGKKIYITLNTFPHSLDITKLKKHIAKLVKLAPDALIIADPGILQLVRENFDIPIHLSTQANTTNQLSAKFWQNQGVERVVLARELSLKEIRNIHKNCNVELEAFVHGAMCMAYSGRCQISNYMTNRDPNQGQCIQACRFKYKIYGLEEDLRKDEFFPIYEDEEGTHILNSKDLCMIKHIPELINAGVTSFKIEGRLKTEYYVATVVRTYRKAIDLIFPLMPTSCHPEETKDLCLGKVGNSISKLSNGLVDYKKERQNLQKEVEKSANRGFTTGFYLNKPNSKTNNYPSSKAQSKYGYIGRVLEYNKETKILTFECKNYLPINSILEIITPVDTITHKLSSMTIKKEPAIVAHANNIIEIPFGSEIVKDSLIRIQL